MNNKIVSLSEIEKIVTRLRKEGKTIVTTNGAFDLFHAGHLKSLLFANDHGDILIAAINSDKSIKSYKSEKRPIIPQDQRAEILSALDCVDYVVLFDDENPVRILSIIKPDVHIKGVEYKEKIPEKIIVEKNGGKVVFLERSDVSTTGIINRILKLYGDGNGE